MCVCPSSCFLYFAIYGYCHSFLKTCFNYKMYRIQCCDHSQKICAENSSFSLAVVWRAVIQLHLGTAVTQLHLVTVVIQLGMARAESQLHLVTSASNLHWMEIDDQAEVVGRLQLWCEVRQGLQQLVVAILHFPLPSSKD